MWKRGKIYHIYWGKLDSFVSCTLHIIRDTLPFFFKLTLMYNLTRLETHSDL